jgi:hypothetical protein
MSSDEYRQRSIEFFRLADPRAHAVAKALLEAAQRGERDPMILCDHAVRHSGLLSK